MVPRGPTRADAQRAAEALGEAGVGRVLLVGSVARGEQTPDSDIDLIAIYDDLNYEDRWIRRSELARCARKAAGSPVDLLVTDAPEWKVRTTKVPCSVEAALHQKAVQLYDSGVHTDIDWGKEIGLPNNPTGEIEARHTDMVNAIARLAESMRISADEEADIREGNRERFRRSENRRFAMGCAHAHLVLENGAKALIICTTGTTPPHWHDVEQLAAQLPAAEQAEWRRRGGGADPDLHLWRQGASYSADQPIESFDERYLATVGAAAANIAEHVVDTCEAGNIDPALIREGRDELERLRAALGSKIRIEADHPIRH